MYDGKVHQIALPMPAGCRAGVGPGADGQLYRTWSRVIQQDDGLAAEQAGVERAQQLREAAKAMYLPKVDVGASYTHLDQPMELDMLDLNPIANHPNSARCWGP